MIRCFLFFIAIRGAFIFIFENGQFYLTKYTIFLVIVNFIVMYKLDLLLTSRVERLIDFI